MHKSDYWSVNILRYMWHLTCQWSNRLSLSKKKWKMADSKRRKSRQCITDYHSIHIVLLDVISISIEYLNKYLLKFPRMFNINSIFVIWVVMLMQRRKICFFFRNQKSFCCGRRCHKQTRFWLKIRNCLFAVIYTKWLKVDRCLQVQ